MVAYQVLTIADVANGLLMYVAQAFLLAGSIFYSQVLYSDWTTTLRKSRMIFKVES